MAGNLTKAQVIVICKMRHGSVIGELSDIVNGRYELFTLANSESHFELQRLNKNTVFALLALGLIRQDNSIAKQMQPFSRDSWYVVKR